MPRLVHHCRNRQRSWTLFHRRPFVTSTDLIPMITPGVPRTSIQDPVHAKHNQCKAITSDRIPSTESQWETVWWFPAAGRYPWRKYDHKVRARCPVGTVQSLYLRYWERRIPEKREQTAMKLIDRLNNTISEVSRHAHTFGRGTRLTPRPLTMRDTRVFRPNNLRNRSILINCRGSVCTSPEQSSLTMIRKVE